MSTVLDIDNLLESPLADLHALAGELDIEGYRLLKKPDLTIAILETRGAIADEIRPAVEAKASELARVKAERERELAEREEAEEAEREAEREAAAAARRAQQPRGESGGRTRGGRGQRGGRGRGGRGAERSERGERTPRERGGEKAGATAEGGRGRGRGRDQKDEKPRDNEPTTPISGVFEPGSGGGGRLRTDLSRRVRGDADVPRGEVRRWNLQRGDMINAQARKSKRGRTDFVVASIDAVNSQDLEARKQKSAGFEQQDAAPVAGRYAKKLFKHAPIGAGSRAVVTGPTRAAASEMLGKLAGELTKDGVVTTLVIVAARPEQATAAEGYAVIAGDATKPPEDVVPALELVLERDKRLAESGRETALLVDGLDLLPSEKAAEVFNTARNLAQAGAVSIVASAGAGSPLEAQATAIGVVAGGRRLKLDKKASWSQ